jgi:uncharacterized DUF497 family protein
MVGERRVVFDPAKEGERRVVFDPAKEEANLAKHGVSLSLVGVVLDGMTATIPDDRHDYGEVRLVTFGYVGDRLHVASWTMWGDTIRAISVRKANSREQRRYG